MKAHKISLEIAAKRFGGFAATRLPILYDRAKAKLLGAESGSISSEPEFPMCLEAIGCKLESHEVKVCRAIDSSTGHYIVLTKFTSGDMLLEIGQIVSAEFCKQGQVMARAW